FAEVVTAGDVALRLVRFKALAGLLLAVRGDDWHAAEFFAVGLGVGPAGRSALEDSAAHQLRRPREVQRLHVGYTRRAIEEWFGQWADIGYGALHLAGDHEKVGRVAREAANRWRDDNIAGREGLHQLFKLRPVGRGAGDLLAEYLFATGRLKLVHLPGF